MLLNKKRLFLGIAKQSAKVDTKNARRDMTHEFYKQFLSGGETVQLVNNRLASSKHPLTTFVCYTKSLFGCDDKRYILDDKITTLHYGHHA